MKVNKLIFDRSLHARSFMTLRCFERRFILQIVFIGIEEMQETDIRSALDYCLLTSEEVPVSKP